MLWWVNFSYLWCLGPCLRSILEILFWNAQKLQNNTVQYVINDKNTLQKLRHIKSHKKMIPNKKWNIEADEISSINKCYKRNNFLWWIYHNGSFQKCFAKFYGVLRYLYHLNRLIMRNIRIKTFKNSIFIVFFSWLSSKTFSKCQFSYFWIQMKLMS